MRILPLFGEAILCFSLCLLLVFNFCHGDDKSFEVVGFGECADCAQHDFKPSQAFSGLRVNVDCKTSEGHFKTRASSELDEEGKFKVSLPKEIVKDDGELKEECYAQLHSAKATPCPSHDDLKSSKIVLKSKDNGKHTFGLSDNLKFSPITCASAAFWPHFHKKHHLFSHPFFKKPHPPKPEEPKKELPPPAPKKEVPTPAPTPKKELPPPAPKKEAPKKEAPPKKKEKEPLPPKVPTFKKPCPPIFKKPFPPHPIFKKPFTPHPFFKKPEPPKPKPKPGPKPPKPKPPHPFFKHPFFKHPFFKPHPPITIPHHPGFGKHHP